jgi:hypothetical protein
MRLLHQHPMLLWGIDFEWHSTDFHRRKIVMECTRRNNTHTMHPIDRPNIHAALLNPRSTE